MKKVTSALVLSAVTALTPAFAEDGDNYSTNATTAQVVLPVQASQTTTLADLSFAFTEEQAQNVQVANMSNQQMTETEGAFIPAPVVYYGVVYGVPASYAVANWANGPGPQILTHKIHNWWNNR